MHKIDLLIFMSIFKDWKFDFVTRFLSAESTNLQMLYTILKGILSSSHKFCFHNFTVSVVTAVRSDLFTSLP